MCHEGRPGFSGFRCSGMSMQRDVSAMAGCTGSIILFAEKLAVGGLFSFLPFMEKTIFMD